MTSSSTPIAPIGYQWLIDRKMVGFEPFTQLQPWHYLPPEHQFWASERWPGVTEKLLYAFAKRQDCDDLACFVVAADNAVKGIALIHGWTGNGYEVGREFVDFWEWMKHVIDDVAEWANVEE
ncbi:MULTISPECIES: hypothetical protein [Burkholderia]|jgi:hypothetical protein|uniref:hypothetical protein n=1 Tax=Burkholderia TaxID=32008 RepID=UPI0009302D9F|nr:MULTISPECIES: hypothetical protein [Burkholderia]MBR8152665.1 hypothetical protein [Burkholderia vietnamiensis]MCA7986913.1 hypothetical protein [Burkholderia vietnamiensis]MCA8287483.1 hypothetical protein [Burkholderia vietnamiensis]GBH23879.1 hypothetical protein BvRS1_09280 [Burkholderia vietnamiensis]HDR8933585.1 hypothetical protein [Burkholderia vietnamiensis]